MGLEAQIIAVHGDRVIVSVTLACRSVLAELDHDMVEPLAIYGERIQSEVESMKRPGRRAESLRSEEDLRSKMA